MREENAVLSPSQVGRYIKGFMDRDRLLSNILVRGEVSNYKKYPSGHHYFTLKDAEGALRCVMFRSDAMSLRFLPQNGMQVIASGRVTVFPRDGQYQLYCSSLHPEGAGDLHIAFEQLKEKLNKEGMFDRSHKKQLPSIPRKIALVTSPAGAAVHDMLRILKARWPIAEVYILPVRVQGEGAAEEIASALSWCSDHRIADLIITGRGGGSMEDLWAFNEEVVARAIYSSEIPVISAVGHEPDFTIADFVADLRAATPSNGAELAVPDIHEIGGILLNAKNRMEHALRRRLIQERERILRAADSRAIAHPESYFQGKRQLLDMQYRNLISEFRNCLSDRRRKLASLAAALDAMSPLKVLHRGYSIATDENGHIVTESDDTEIGDILSLKLLKGTLKCRVEQKL